MDSIMGLPQIVNGYDTIWVIVDKFSESAHLLPIKVTCIKEDLVELYIRKVVKLHGVP